MLDTDDINRKKEAFEKNYHAFEAEKFYRFRRPWIIRAAIGSTIVAIALGLGWLVDHAVNFSKLSDINARYSVLKEKTADYDQIKEENVIMKRADVELQQLNLDYAKLSEAHKSLEARLNTSSEKTRRLVVLDDFFRAKSEKYHSIINENIFAEDYTEWESRAAKLDELQNEISREDYLFSGLPTSNIDLLLSSVKKVSALYRDISRMVKNGASSASSLEAVKKEIEDYRKKAEADIKDWRSKYEGEAKKLVEALKQVEEQKKQAGDLDQRLKALQGEKDDAVHGRDKAELELAFFKGTHSHTDAEYASREQEIKSLKEKSDKMQGQLDSLTAEYHKMLINGCTRLPKKDGVRYLYFHIDYYTQRDPPTLKEVGGEWDLETCQKLEIFKQLVPENMINEYNHKAKSSGFRFARVEVESAEGQGDKYYLSLVFSNSSDNVQTRAEYLSIIAFIKNSIMNK